MKLSARKYSLPFARPFRTAGGIFSRREGIILTLRTGNLTALGEAAPLPGFSGESLSDAGDRLFQFRHELVDLFRSPNPVAGMALFLEERNLPPSLEFGLDTLACDLEAKKMKIPFHRRLFGRSARPVPVNGLISLFPDENENEDEGENEKVLSSVGRLVGEGYETVKIKVGGDRFDRELQQLRSIRSRYPELVIRVDANRSWTLKEAATNLRLLEPAGIEYCEEPLRKASAENYRRLKEETGIALAIDETVYRNRNWKDLLSSVSIIILKPMVAGSFAKNFATFALADTHDTVTVVTTSLESGIGRTATAAFASGRGTEHAAHGLSTGTLFREDFLPGNFCIKNGKVSLSKEPGLGSADDFELQKTTAILFEEHTSD